MSALSHRYVCHILQNCIGLDVPIIHIVWKYQRLVVLCEEIESIYHLRTESRKKLDGKSKKCIITEMPILLGIVLFVGNWK